MRIIRLKYLFNDHSGNPDLDGEIIRGIHREFLEYKKDPNAEYVPVNPTPYWGDADYKKVPKRMGQSETERKRGDGFD